VAHLDCDAVVCTLPLGVMQSGDVQFDPPLPPDKRRAIRLLGCGVVSDASRESEQTGRRSINHLTSLSCTGQQRCPAIRFTILGTTRTE